LDVILDNLPFYTGGLVVTVVLTLSSFLTALVVGTAVAAMRVSPVPPLRGAGLVYVEVFRNTPLTLLMALFAFGLPKLGFAFDFPIWAWIVLSVYTSAFVTETVRSGINSVAQGQAEAARSIGLTFQQTLLLVVLPQAVRTVVQPLGSLFIALTKNSSIAATIGVGELVYNGDRVNTLEADPLWAFLGVAVAYLILTLPSGALVGALERRVAIKR
jgi:glutamate transport system permease protein